MVVCAMQSYATEKHLDGCSATKSTETTQTKDAGIVDNGNGDEEDREEGEIVDEFEMIISSEDEEFKLRARIQQLEDKSKDIEKMDMLSANLSNQYSKHCLICATRSLVLYERMQYIYIIHICIYIHKYAYHYLCLCVCVNF